MKKHLYTLLPALLVLASLQGYAQRTGSFDTTLPFMSADRAVSMYVPPSYNPATKYRLLVGLHGLGDTCHAYRNGLINALGWGTNIPNTIFVFPEAANRYADYYLPAGGEEIIRESILFAMSQYHIDSADVVLQGFSLGGRAALRFGIDNDTLFKGLLLNTPAIQGVKEALNGHPLVYSFNYGKGSRIPIYITHGQTDILYTAPIDSTVEQLMLHDARVRLFRFPGLGHDIPPFSQIQDVFSFFEQPEHKGHDLELVGLKIPPRTCSSVFSPHVLVRNTGENPIIDAKIQIQANGGAPTTMVLSGTLQPYQHGLLPLPPVTLNNGYNTLTATIIEANGIPDSVGYNNVTVRHIEYAAQAQALPLTEGFESSVFPPPGWHLERAGDTISAWAADDIVAKTGNQSANAFNTILVFDNAGRREGLVSPVLNLQAAARLQLSFDIAYNYHHYTPPYIIPAMSFADTLEVMLSTDCGDHYSSLFRKGGADLATFAEPILNPLDLASCFTEPADSNWARINIALPAFTSPTKAVLKFSYISALGGSINIDNVSVAEAGSSKPEVRHRSSVFPNPATDVVVINPGGDAISRIAILDAAGRTVLALDRNAQDSQPVRIDVRSLPAALYTLQLFSGQDVHTSKLSVRH